MTGEILRDQAVGVAGDTIRYILPIAEAPADLEIVDLPQTALLPGFVNAHCHLDLSHMAGEFMFQGSFSGWIREVMSRRLLPDADAMRVAAEALIRSGVTTVYDHVGPWSDISSVLDLPLRYRFFVEVSGVTVDEAKRRLEMAEDLALRLRREGHWAAPTPHAPYSLHADVLKRIVNSPSPQPSPPPEADWRQGEGGFSIHYAESAEEAEYWKTGTGKMAEFLGELGICHPEAKPKDLIEMLRGACPERSRRAQHDRGWLAIHCNTVSDAEIALLKSTHATVVHCPRSHRYFNHPPFPLEKLRAAGIPIAIGTDSLASCPNFDFLEELRAMREEFPVLTTEEVLDMAWQTGGAERGPHFRQQPSPETHSSQLLNEGDADKWGASATGPVCHAMPKTPADIIGLPLQNDILQGPVTFSMIGGRRVI